MNGLLEDEIEAEVIEHLEKNQEQEPKLKRNKFKSFVKFVWFLVVAVGSYLFVAPYSPLTAAALGLVAFYFCLVR